MWVARFQLLGEGLFFGNAAKSFGIELTGYPVSSYERNKRLFLNLVGTMRGSENAKSDFLSYLKRQKCVLHLESHGDFLMLQIEESSGFKPFYSPHFLYLSPVHIDADGTYTYHMGCWEKKNLQGLLDFVAKAHFYELKSLKQENVANVSVLGVQPALTEKQKEAYTLAVTEGYYEYPKRIELQELARVSGLSYSAFHQHLKIAEKKISRFLTGKY